jgi:hypothetical protein
MLSNLTLGNPKCTSIQRQYTSVRISVETIRVKTGEPYCSLHAMLAANLDGPSDWSERIHEYLYGEDCRSVD